MEYTKGPWEVRPGYGLLMSEIGPRERAVATVWTKKQATTQEGKSTTAPDAVGEANAQLIAASPEMYEALKAISMILLVTEYSVEERIKLIEQTVNRVFTQTGIKNILSILSEEHAPKLATALDELEIPAKEGDNLRSMTDILDDLSKKWQELEGRQS